MCQKYRASAVLALALLGMASNAAAQTAPRYEDLRPLRGEWSAADTIGSAVRSADGARVGEIHDLILSSDAKVVTAVVSVGGFIGIADKLVAVPYDNLRLWSDDESLAVSLTSAEIESAPEHGRASPAVGDSEPVIDPAKAEPPNAAIRQEAEEEASQVFAGDDPRVADGIAENKKAYEDAEAEEDATEEGTDL